MAIMPIRPMVAPTPIRTQPNGAVADSLLEVVDERTGYLWKLASNPARGMRALHAAILGKFGVRLSSTGRGRSYDTQYTAFLQRHSPVSKQVYDTLPAKGGKRRLWPEAVTRHHLTSMYWALKPGMAPAAIPGTSPHGLWCADDICLPGNKPITDRPDILNWLYDNELDYGFAHSLLVEPWHIQHVSGDIIPPAVLAYESQNPTPPPTPPSEDDMAYAIYKCVNPPAVLGGYTIKPQLPAIQVEHLADDARINALRGAGAVDYPTDLQGKTALKHATLLGPLPPGYEAGWFAKVVA